MMIHGKKTICVAVVLVAAVTTFAWAEDPYEVEWIAQIGTIGNEGSTSVAVDGFGNAYITGSTYGDPNGPHGSANEAFVSKFDSSGNEAWTTYSGTSNDDLSRSIAVDALGNAYISGYTYGDLGGPNAGHSDAFLIKYDSGGNEVWATQIGTNDYEFSFSVAIDASGNAYISGKVNSYASSDENVYLGKYDSAGNEVWTTSFGTSGNDRSESIAVNASGDIYICGHTRGNLGGPHAGGYTDAYVSRLDSSGNRVWTTQIGTSAEDYSYSVAPDGFGNAYIAGRTKGDLGGPNAGSHDAFLSKFDSDGNELWRTQIGTSGWDESHSVAVDSSGNIYISGDTDGDLGGPNAGGYDPFLMKFDSGGNEVWRTQIGSISSDSISSIALDVWGNVFISGSTWGDFGGPNAGQYDAVLVKFEVPEPATLSLLALGGLAVLRRRRKR